MKDVSQYLDFVKISTKRKKPLNEEPYIEVFPKFVIKKTDDLMIRGRDFYAAWSEEKGCWTTDEQDVLNLIDIKLDEFAKAHKDEFQLKLRVAHMWDSTSGSIDSWHKYCQKQMRDNYHNLDEKIIFSNDKAKKEDYSSKHLDYPLEEGDISGFDRLIGTLYSPEEREKIEWGIGAIVSGESKNIQKFLVLHGDPGTGKSTIINIIQKMFTGYWEAFDAEALGSSSNAFALEPFKNNPLIGIQHDGNLSRLENNARINSLTSHETMTVNEKNKSIYSMRFNAFLIMGTNKPVRITDAKSGLIRRLIDITPTGHTIPVNEYDGLLNKISFELGAIAYHCLQVFWRDPGKYDHYIPVRMLSATNDFYNFIYENFFIFKKDDGTSMKAAWELYKNYCEEAKVSYPMSQRVFKEELANYFEEVLDRYTLEDGTRVRTYYHRFKTDKFEKKPPQDKNEPSIDIPEWLQLSEQPSIFDELAKGYPAQYNADDGTERPKYKWKNCKTALNKIKTRELHWVKVPIYHIIIDFDIKNEKGEKDLSLNLKAASEWPETYAELSKGGQGLHLHYIYEGDPLLLDSIYAKDIEIKVYDGDKSLRRRLSLCNNRDISKISTGLPVKKEKKKKDVLNVRQVKSEERLRTQIQKCLDKEHHGYTKPEIDFMVKILSDAYDSDLSYDISDMMPAIILFAANSNHNSDYCLSAIDLMHFQSKDKELDISEPNVETEEFRGLPIAFYDVEVFPNLFLVNWKEQGKDKPITRWINPNKDQIVQLISGYRLIGFNNRNYDNHMIYGCMLGYNNKQLYNLSSGLISDASAKYKFRDAYDLSYTDIYDYSSKKQSLKKWEIEMGINHMELGFRWDEPVPEEDWNRVAEYCDNDVLATEALFDYIKADFDARLILAKISGGTVNDTTNTLTTKLIFGNNRHPQNEFIYTNLRTMFPGYTFDKFGKKGQKSKYRGEFVGEGGYVYARPGLYRNVALLDIASMHPHSIIALKLFGERYTKIYEDLVHARIYVKHRDKEELKKIFGGALAEYTDADDETLTNLAGALKIAINSVYGLTSAKFDNPFRDSRNIDNIVAKRGALFMVDLKHAVEDKGFIVAHIKTDSIKIPDATPEIIQFVMEFGKGYGYSFEHEATYDRMCLVNDAVYIAKYSDDKEINGKHAGEWTATGTQFQVPYVFKTLFTHEPVVFDDLCETKSAKTSIYLDMNEGFQDLTEVEKRITKLNKAIDKDNKAYFDILGKYPSEAVSTQTFNEEDTAMIAELNRHTEEIENELEDLYSQEKAGHNYQFVGKVGRFTPILPGAGGGVLVRENGEKYSAVTGTKGYRWLESESVKGTPKEKMIDHSYYENLANEAIAAISKHGDFYEFVA